MRELANQTCTWIAATSLQATLLLAAAWLLERLLVRRLWPQLLLTLWLVALARLLAPPTIASPWSVTSSLGESTIAVARESASQAPTLLLAIVWALGVGVCLVARAIRCASVRRTIVRLDAGASSCAPWRLAVHETARAFGLQRSPRLATLSGLSQPAVFGLLRPTLLLPASWIARAPTQHDRHALLHEIAHVQRADLWLDEACELVRALFWFHPLVWLAVRRVRALTELACDASVARRIGSNARGYRDTLVHAARELLAAQAAPAGTRAFVAHGSSLVLRIERLQSTPRATLVQIRACSTAFALTLAACVLPMAPSADSLRLAAQQVFDAELSGTRQSCYSLRAAAMVLAADDSPSSSNSDS